MRRLLAVVLVSVGAALAAAGSGAAGDVRADEPLSWKRCGGRFECATLDVPLDYADAASGTLSLALIRQPAADPSKKIGSLLANPGGPGASGVEFTRYWAGVLSPEIADRFDIVGFDPRGVGQSTPIVCHDTLKAYIAADPAPDNQAEWDTLVRETRAFSDGCARKYGNLLPYLGTKNVARDMDRIRAALGDSKLTYLGYSYGTEIGQVYADLFPRNIRAMVLDGAMDLSLSTDDRTLTQITGFERALDAFLAKCRKDGCRISKRGDPATVIDDLLKKAEAAPIPSKSADRPAGPGEALLGMIEALYTDARWADLDRAVDAALGGDGSRLVQLTDDYLQRTPGGDYANIQEANVAVNCVDQAPSALPTAFKDFPAVAAKFAEKAPHFGPAVANGLTCAFWPAKPDPVAAPKAQGAPPVLVVSTTGDPATPYEWGVAVSKQLPGAVLLSYGGQGHTVYGGKNACVDEAVNRYLIDLALPPAGSVCGNREAMPQSPPPTEPASGAAANPSTTATGAGAAATAPRTTAAAAATDHSGGSGDGLPLAQIAAGIGVALLILAGTALVFIRRPADE